MIYWYNYLWSNVFFIVVKILSCNFSNYFIIKLALNVQLLLIGNLILWKILLLSFIIFYMSIRFYKTKRDNFSYIVVIQKNINQVVICLKLFSIMYIIIYLLYSIYIIFRLINVSYDSHILYKVYTTILFTRIS